MTDDSAPSQILLTGGTGFIGRPLCTALRERGVELTVLTRNKRRAARRLGEGVNLVESLDQLPPIGFDAVINLAGEPLASARWNDKRKETFRRSRIGTTEALLSHFQQLGQFPKVLISGSAIGYYGEGGDRPLTESDGPGVGFGAEMCRDWEAVADRFADMGVRVCRLRTGIVLEQGGGALQSMMLPFKMGLGGRISSGRQWMSWIHRDDLIGLILHCLDNPQLQGAVNGTAPNPVTNRVFTRILAKALHRPALFPAPAPILRLVFADMADELLLASQRVLPETAINSGYVFRYTELAPALDAIFQKNDPSNA